MVPVGLVLLTEGELAMTGNQHRSNSGLSGIRKELLYQQETSQSETWIVCMVEKRPPSQIHMQMKLLVGDIDVEYVVNV